MKAALVCAEYAGLEVLEHAHQAATKSNQSHSLDKKAGNSVLAVIISHEINSPFYFLNSLLHFYY